jgi:hypothetical protein
VPSGDEICFPKGELGQKNYGDISVTLGVKCPFYSTVKNWVVRFRVGHLSTEDHEHSGRPTQVTVPEKVDAIHSMILDVGSIIHEISDMRKLSAKWVPKCLSAGQKHDRVLVSQAILYQFRQDPVGFFNHLVTVDETWIHIYDPEIAEQSKEQRQWFPTSKEVQDTEVIKQGVGICLLGQRWNFACRLLGKECNRNGKVLSCTF